MLRLARRSGIRDLVRLVVSVRAPGDLYYAGELPGPETSVIYTRTVPPTHPRPPGHLTERDLAAALLPDAVAYICGSSPFSDAAAELAMKMGVEDGQIRIERFGPTA